MAIELRSDTFTLPTPAMKQAMFDAPLGDDVFNEDPTVKALEQKVANLFGMEAALFATSGTMTNQIAIAAHIGKGQEVICDAMSHIYFYEGGGIMANAGASVKLLKGDLGRISVTQIKEAISPDDIHFCESALVSLENSMNKGGGSVYSTESLNEISSFCKANKLPLHLDGARVFNAMVATGQTPLQYGQWFDSISVCLSKGLGAPIGSVLLGTEAFIKKAKRVRKRFGGGWRQAGLLAAAGIYALDNQVDRLKEDHRRAQKIGEYCKDLSWIKNVLPVDTNIVIVELRGDLLAPQVVNDLKNKGILCNAFGNHSLRFVTHLDFTDQHLQEFMDILKE
ncbi:aminotransferase class I/II-fold pyridoxal phosphate-dependent enzyme [Sandaracinomonas limnophila]|uniref:Aminotransferase class I/II-fold pyridoxal phosphate-dependent enzyme n=1 Tax=Sandaracinomonas limnophila TaxID=1862386 RepID=A0A437PXA2_9BACT|nr:GntG family PLP-dependent aldolase [Sandaracinomonas limnophila]RVU26882.1 aminotransferase class I/II-fold pyridoxal phosphate-dependent enzyme [Sandaracinomonas limnophila]